jgi:hypothetical protein
MLELWQIAVKYTRFPLHIHASIRKNEAEQVLKHFDYRDSLDFSGITFEKKMSDLEFFHKISDRIRNLISVFNIMWYMPFLWAKVFIFQGSPHQMVWEV